jgi:phenylacetate-CoA ligase
MNLFSRISSLQGLPLDLARREFSRLKTLSVNDFLVEQEMRKWDIFHYHVKQNAFYQNLIKNRSITRWEDIPIMQKGDFQRPLLEILSSVYPYKRVYMNSTSGSTGKPFHFAKDRYAHAMTWAYIIDKYKELGLNYGSSLQARFFGIPLSRSKYVKEKIKDYFSARVRFPIFDLSDDVLSRYYKSFRSHRFDYIYGYTSSLVLFAKYVNKVGVSLKKICPSLKCCIVTSEVCSPEDRVELQLAFGIPVYNEYGAAELDIIAFESQEGQWKLNEENLFIEIVSEEGKPVPAGQEGLVVVTSLFNKAMPFIRYNLGDMVSLQPERSTYHRLIKTMQGRMNDVALLPSGKKAPGLTFYYVSKSLLEQSGMMKEFVIKQLKENLFHFEYVAEEALSIEQKLQVQKLMDLYLEPGLLATFERLERIERTQAGKFKHFQYLVEVH